MKVKHSFFLWSSTDTYTRNIRHITQSLMVLQPMPFSGHCRTSMFPTDQFDPLRATEYGYACSIALVLSLSSRLDKLWSPLTKANTGQPIKFGCVDHRPLPMWTGVNIARQEINTRISPIHNIMTWPHLSLFFDLHYIASHQSEWVY